jgi:hypothetical protein
MMIFASHSGSNRNCSQYAKADADQNTTALEIRSVSERTMGTIPLWYEVMGASVTRIRSKQEDATCTVQTYPSRPGIRVSFIRDQCMSPRTRQEDLR